MDVATIIAAVTGAFAGTAFPAAVAWRFMSILTKELRDLTAELHGFRVELAKAGCPLAAAPHPEGGQ